MTRIAVERGEHLKKGRIAQEILRVLSERSMHVPSLKGANISAAFLPRLERKGIGKKRKNSIRVAVNRLQRQRFIEYTMAGEENIMRLTSAGEKRIQQYNLEDLELNTASRWDGLWRLVMFDIPEEKKRARDALSKKLKLLGFHQLQRSVFVHFAPCREEIEFVEDYFSIPGCISYVEAKSLGSQENKIRKHFKIK